MYCKSYCLPIQTASPCNPQIKLHRNARFMSYCLQDVDGIRACTVLLYARLAQINIAGTVPYVFKLISSRAIDIELGTNNIDIDPTSTRYITRHLRILGKQGLTYSLMFYIYIKTDHSAYSKGLKEKPAGVNEQAPLLHKRATITYSVKRTSNTSR